MTVLIELAVPVRKPHHLFDIPNTASDCLQECSVAGHFTFSGGNCTPLSLPFDLDVWASRA